MDEATAQAHAPEVTTVLPVRDGASTIACAIESIRRQTFADWELLVIDDGSTDETAAIAASFGDARIKVIRDGRPLGLAARLNEGICLARGRYLARMDADDVAYPARFAKQVVYLDDHTDVDLLGTRALLFRSDGEPAALFPFRATHEDICARPWNGFYLAHPTWMGRIEWFRRFMYRIPEVMRAEDQELLLRSYGSSRFACLSDLLLGYRVGEQALPKVLAARMSLARAQLEVHSGQGRPLNAVLGTTTFLAKAVLDILRYVATGARKPARHLAGPVPAEDAERWRAVWESIAPVCEPPPA